MHRQSAKVENLLTQDVQRPGDKLHASVRAKRHQHGGTMSIGSGAVNRIDQADPDLGNPAVLPGDRHRDSGHARAPHAPAQRHGHR